MSEETDNKPPRVRRASASKLPSAVDALVDDPDLRAQVISLLEHATAVKVVQSELAEEEDQIKQELAAVCETYKLPGLRFGLNCFEYYGYKVRETLSKEALLNLGVPAETIAAAYKAGKPYLSTKIDPFDQL